MIIFGSDLSRDAMELNTPRTIEVKHMASGYARLSLVVPSVEAEALVRRMEAVLNYQPDDTRLEAKLNQLEAMLGESEGTNPTHQA